MLTPTQKDGRKEYFHRLSPVAVLRSDQGGRKRITLAERNYLERP
jgi:hypothetical protein